MPNIDYYSKKSIKVEPNPHQYIWGYLKGKFIGLGIYQGKGKIKILMGSITGLIVPVDKWEPMVWL